MRKEEWEKLIGEAIDDEDNAWSKVVPEDHTSCKRAALASFQVQRLSSDAQQDGINFSTLFVNRERKSRQLVTSDMSGIGGIIRNLRAGIDLSGNKLAVDAGIDRAYLSRIENNKQRPSWGVLLRLAPHLHVTVVGLLKAAGYLESSEE